LNSSGFDNLKGRNDVYKNTKLWLDKEAKELEKEEQELAKFRPIKNMGGL